MKQNDYIIYFEGADIASLYFKKGSKVEFRFC